MIKVNDKHLIKEIDYKKYEDSVKEVHQIIHEKSGPGNDFLGWLNYPETFDKVEFEAIKKYAKYVRENFEVLVVFNSLRASPPLYLNIAPVSFSWMFFSFRITSSWMALSSSLSRSSFSSDFRI